MAGINDNDILDRILENLNHAANNLIGDSATAPKFEVIKFGDPPNDNKNAEAGNAAYVKQSTQPFVSTQRIGTDNGRKRNNETRQYEVIIITSQDEDPATSLRNLNTLTFKTKEVIEKNRHLAKPDGTLPIAIDVKVMDVARDASMFGGTRQSNNLVVRYDFVVE